MYHHPQKIIKLFFTYCKKELTNNNYAHYDCFEHRGRPFSLIPPVICSKLVYFVKIGGFMKRLLLSIRNFFKYNPKSIIKHFLSAELDTLNKEILDVHQYLKKLEVKRNRIKLMVIEDKGVLI
jgi:hypothetical protein